MKLAIMQPYFMPYIGYFQAIAAVDRYILYDNLTFIKDGWMNRNRIRLINGNVITITVPLIGKSSNSMIRDVLIDNSQKWSKKLLTSITLNYGRSPYFHEVFPLFENIFSHQYIRLVDLNVSSILQISSFLDIDTDIVFDNSKYLDMESKLETVEYGIYSSFDYLESTKPIKKVARVIVMCKNENSNFFVNAIGGVDLYDKSEFSKYGISLNFIKTNNLEYPQFSEPFEPNLSIIDVLMFNGKEGTKKLLNEYTLV